MWVGVFVIACVFGGSVYTYSISAVFVDTARGYTEGGSTTEFSTKYFLVAHLHRQRTRTICYSTAAERSVDCVEHHYLLLELSESTKGRRIRQSVLLSCDGWATWQGFLCLTATGRSRWRATVWKEPATPFLQTSEVH